MKMAQENKDINYNDEETIKVWRYMDIPKFISTLDKSSLFFARSDKLNDPSEGLLTAASNAEWYSHLKGVSVNDPFKPFAESIINCAINIPEKVKPYIFINSWHMNPIESMLMWYVYANNNKGVSIQSTLRKLNECLQNNQCYYNKELIKSPIIYRDKVEYVNFKTYIEDCSNKEWHRNSFFKKPDCFTAESEYRALIDLSSAVLNGNLEKEYGFDYLKTIKDYGISIKVPIKNLIDKIYVCPLAPDWVLDVVKSIANKYDIGEDKVVRSDLLTGEFK